MILRPVRSAYGTQFIPHVLQSHTAHSKSIDIVYLLLLTPSKQIQSKIKSKIPSCYKTVVSVSARNFAVKSTNPSAW